MTYIEALEFIHGTLKFGSVLGLDNIKYLLGLLGNPQDSLNIIHVAGTNGKGSTCAFISEILKSNGYKTGMYTSPYITEFRERIQIDRQYISEDDLALYTYKVKEQIDVMVNAGMQHPTEFEIITALALLYYKEKACDFVVLEVGLGGELDATNAVDNPLVSVITSISMDHMDRLGDTIEKIARTKCGIIKPGGTTVSYPLQDDAVQAIIKDTADKMRSRLIVPDITKLIVGKSDLEGSEFEYIAPIKIGLLGEFQIYNAITALCVIQCLREKFEIPEIYEGFANAKLPGRFEIISREPLIIFDGAHNYSGVSAFRDAAQMYLKDKHKIIITGMLADKEYKKCIKETALLADQLILTKPDNPRALNTDILKNEALKYNSDITVAESKEEALQIAKAMYRDNSVICICGSLYLYLMGLLHNWQNA